jgi:hypothetical protein
MTGRIGIGDEIGEETTGIEVEVEFDTQIDGVNTASKLEESFIHIFVCAFGWNDCVDEIGTQVDVVDIEVDIDVAVDTDE